MNYSLLALALWSSSSALAHPTSPSEACQQIDRIYQSCSTRYRFDGRTFEFPIGRERATVACSDGRKLPYFDRLDNMDISSIMMFPYVAGPVPLPEKRKNWDPARLRSEALFKASFGHNEAAVRETLVPVNFLGQTIKFQRRLGAAAALKRVSDELLAEAARDPSLAKILSPFTTKKTDLRYYGFFWRNVKGTSRLSSHAFGTGIDMLTDEGPQYWLWDEQKRNPDKAAQGENAYRNDHYIPTKAPIFHPKAVAIFEKNGFVWGGKWNHYDTMHFEYRPEFLPSTRIDCSQEEGNPFQDAMESLDMEASDFGPHEATH